MDGLDSLVAIVINDVLEELQDDDDDDHAHLTFLHSLVGIRRLSPKVYTFENVIETGYNEIDFKADFRISRGTFHILLQELTPILEFPQREQGRCPVTAKKQLYIFLWYMANQVCMREMGRLFGVGKFTIHRCVNRVARAICNSLKKKMISWPDLQTQEEIAARINGISHIPGVIGFIDGTHVRLSQLPHRDRDYINRKGYPSVVLQLIATDTTLIIDAFVGWPGSAHDARVYRNSSIFHSLAHDNGQKLGPNKFIIGDAAYPLSAFLMTPFRHTGNLTQAQKLYNTKVSSVRQSVERTIGHLKGRFRRLRDLDCKHMYHVCHRVMAACILHNLCVLSGDDFSDYIEDANVIQRVNNYPPVYRNAAEGVCLRNRLVQHLQGYFG